MSDKHERRRTSQWGFTEWSQMVAGLLVVVIHIVAGVFGEGNWMLRFQIMFLAVVLMYSLVNAKRRDEYIERLEWRIRNNAE